MTPNDIDSAQAAWQYLVDVISVETFTEDDSQVFIPEGAYLIIGDKKLVFEKNLDLTNVTGNLEITEQNFRDAAVLKDVDGEEPDTQIVIFMPESARLRIGQSQITLGDNLLTKINDLNIEQEKLNAVLLNAQESTGTHGIILGSLDIFNLIAEGMQNADITVEVQRIEIQDPIIYFDELWDAFANTVNAQAQKTDPKGKLTVQFDAKNKCIDIKICDDCHARGIESIAFGTGLSTAVLNLLKSEQITKISSADHKVETLDEDGNKKRDDDLQSEALDVAFAWLGDDNDRKTPMEEYLIGETVDFILYGELGGEEFSITYEIYFH